MKKTNVKYMTRLAILMAIVIAFTLFNIGNISVGPISATIYHLPVIIGAVMLGVKAGVILGGTWGILCFLLAVLGQTTDIVATTAVATSPLGYFIVAFVPRVLVGLVSALVWKALSKVLAKAQSVALVATGVIGSLTNTVFYLGLLVLIFRNIVANIYGVTPAAVTGIAVGVATSNGLVEAAVSGVITLAVCKALFALDKATSKEK